MKPSSSKKPSRVPDVDTSAATPTDAAPTESPLHGVLLGRVVHDLGSPLSAMLLQGQMALSKQDQPDEAQWLRQRLETMIRIAQRAIEQLHHSALLAELENGSLSLSMRETSLGPLLTDAVAKATPTAAQRRVELQLEESSACEVSCDAGKLGLALQLLLEQAALMVAPRDSIRIVTDASSHEIGVRLRLPAARLELRSLPDDLMSYCSGRRGGPMLSLGLYLAKSLIEAHGGEVAIVHDSAANDIVVSLPRQR